MMQEDIFIHREEVARLIQKVEGLERWQAEQNGRLARIEGFLIAALVGIISTLVVSMMRLIGV